ncbi:unnamed protein product [Polarella glacialis]|uniref:Rhodanese domain-containing protein n=1 Tax=Polarella glacialis TaxID=89957 RepID=A0A813HGJ7_POLGL|nr:unnamed protein product [Polarella glacialis]
MSPDRGQRRHLLPLLTLAWFGCSGCFLLSRNCPLARPWSAWSRPGLPRETSRGKVLSCAGSEERVLDIGALLAGTSAGVLVDEDESENEDWEEMVGRISFEGGIPVGSDFRAPSPTKGAYDANNGFCEVEAQELVEALSLEESAELWDVRGPEEFATGHVPKARNVQFEKLQQAAADRLAAAGSGRLFLICAFGIRSAQAQVRLSQVHGLQGVFNVRGGLASWEALGGLVVAS